MHELGTSTTVTFLKLSFKEGFTGRSVEEDEGRDGPDDGIEVNTGPGEQRTLECEDEERCCGECEGELCDEV